MKKHKLDGGVAFDGDADRCLAVDENGNLLDGDQMIAAVAYDLKERGELRGNTAVVTVMSNLGFFRYCESVGIDVASTKVGDRYVLEEMLKNDLSSAASSRDTSSCASLPPPATVSFPHCICSPWRADSAGSCRASVR